MSALRRIGLPAAGLAAVSIAVGAAVAGSQGVVAAAVGSVVVAVFFASSPLALRGPTSVAPGLSMLLALLFFATKVLVLLAVMTVLLDDDGAGKHVDTPVLGGTIIVSTLVWSFLQIRAATKSRQPLYDLGNKE